ncbi:flagellar basal body-associated protein FliL [Photobacterium kagoshimensis]|uniref:flagellar basal body-associated protein FliL n=1 Tax=Photobacterium kagoshimensis TaxID=2910242 RepID=UPI003D0A76B2
MMKSKLVNLALLLTCMLFSPLSLAEAESAQAKPQYSYYTLAPDITTNYVTQGNRLGYLRLQIDLMVIDPSLVKIVEEHSPLIRDAIITIIGRQPEAKVKSLAGREEIRQACLDTVNELLIAETNQKLLTELLFTKYLYQ